MKKSLDINLLNDHPDQLFFVGVLLIGAFFITLLKAFQVSPFFPILVAISLIIGYCFVSYSFQRFRLPPERIGDNAYYLGFLFTLISLSNALYYYGDGENAGMLISDFGVALGSTIVGVVARTVLHQLRLEVEMIEQGVRESLTESAMNARAQIENLNSEVQLLVEELKENLTSSIKKIIDNNSVISELTQQTLASLAHLTKSIDSEVKALDDTVRLSISTFPKRLQGSLDNINKELSAFKIPRGEIDSLERAIAKVNGEISGLTLNFNNMSKDNTISMTTLMALYLKYKINK
jgi:hypothetical protein